MLAGRSRLRSQEASDWKKSTEQKLQRDPGSEAERNESVSDISNFQDTIPHLGEKTSFKMAQVSSADKVAMREQRKRNLLGLASTRTYFFIKVLIS